MQENYTPAPLKPQRTKRSMVALISVPRVHGTEINATGCSKYIYRVNFSQGVSAGFVFQDTPEI
jgi:hypothetical protein